MSAAWEDPGFYTRRSLGCSPGIDQCWLDSTTLYHAADDARAHLDALVAEIGPAELEVALALRRVVGTDHLCTLGWRLRADDPAPEHIVRQQVTTLTAAVQRLGMSSMLHPEETTGALF